MPILFCNIAWMKHYAGRFSKDPPLGGGKHVNDEGYGNEECNFVRCPDGYVYGHFETRKGKRDRQVHIENLGATKTAHYLDGVDIVWTAPREGKDPRVVVGWFRNARLYRERQRFNRNYPSVQHCKDEIETFMVRAKTKNVVWIEPNQRKLELDRGTGWSGQISWWYADKTKNHDAKKFVEDIKLLMDDDKYVSTMVHRLGGGKAKNGQPAAKAPTDPHYRYTKNFETTIHPRHHELQKKFEKFLKKRHGKKSTFPNVIGMTCVMW